MNIENYDVLLNFDGISQDFKLSCDSDNLNVPFSTDTSINVTTNRLYTGTYNVVPSDTEQTLSTANLLCATNIVVRKIPSNYGKISYDGSTITIT